MSLKNRDDAYRERYNAYHRAYNAYRLKGDATLLIEWRNKYGSRRKSHVDNDIILSTANAIATLQTTISELTSEYERVLTIEDSSLRHDVMMSIYAKLRTISALSAKIDRTLANKRLMQ